MTGQPLPPRARWSILTGWNVLLALLLLGPALGPGYVLRSDLVFTPRQSLLPTSVGLGGGLPRAVPQDAVVALLTTVLPGTLVQRGALLLALLLAGTGVAFLVRGSSLALALVASTAYLWCPYVAERLLIGHWGLLLAYGILPWAVGLAAGVRAGRAWQAPLLVAVGLAALTPTGGLLVAVVAVPIAALRRSWRRWWVLAVGAVVLNGPWWVAAASGGLADRSDATSDLVFGLRAEGPWGALVTALGTGGIWDAGSVPGSRGTLLAPLLTLLLVALGALGARAAVRDLGRATIGWLAAVSAVGLGWALLSSWPGGAGLTGWLLGAVPGAGLLRDAQKWLAPYSLLLALCASFGLRRVAVFLSRLARDRAVAAAVTVLGIAVLVLAQPDLALGIGGRLSPVEYPASWDAARTALAQQSAPGDVLVVPWASFRRFEWNPGSGVLDPAPRYLTRVAVVDDTLEVLHAGELVHVSGEDPRAAAVSAAVDSGRPVLSVLPGLGIGYVLDEVGQPARAAADLTGLRLVGTWSDSAVPGSTLRLWAVPPPVGEWSVPRWQAVVVVTADVAAVLALAAALGVSVRSWYRRRAPLVPSVEHIDQGASTWPR